MKEKLRTGRLFLPSLPDPPQASHGRTRRPSHPFAAPAVLERKEARGVLSLSFFEIRGGGERSFLSTSMTDLKSRPPPPPPFPPVPLRPFSSYSSAVLNLVLRLIFFFLPAGPVRASIPLLRVPRGRRRETSPSLHRALEFRFSWVESRFRERALPFFWAGKRISFFFGDARSVVSRFFWARGR